MDIVQMLEVFKDPNTIHTLSTGDKLTMSLVVTLLGMTITFVALVLLWGCISTMSKVVLSSEKKKDDKPVAKPEPVKAAVANVAVEANNDEEDEELIAVITAAVAASLNTSIHNIVVKNVVQVSDGTPAWGRAGRIEQMNTRF